MSSYSTAERYIDLGKRQALALLQGLWHSHYGSLARFTVTGMSSLLLS